MKFIKIAGTVILLFALLAGVYMVFFSHPGEVKKIMERYKREKSIFESKISKYEIDAAIIERKIIAQRGVIIDIEEKYLQADRRRLEWKKKYEKLKLSPIKKIDDIKTLNECKIEIEKLTFRLGECNEGIEKTEGSLFICQKLNLELKAQKANWKEKYKKLEEKSNDQTLELAKRDQTIHDLKKIRSGINLKKAITYTGIGISIYIAIRIAQSLTTKK